MGASAVFVDTFLNILKVLRGRGLEVKWKLERLELFNSKLETATSGPPLQGDAVP
jgi:hypothetical protein